MLPIPAWPLILAPASDSGPSSQSILWDDNVGMLWDDNVEIDWDN